MHVKVAISILMLNRLLAQEHGSDRGKREEEMHRNEYDGQEVLKRKQSPGKVRGGEVRRCLAVQKSLVYLVRKVDHFTTIWYRIVYCIRSPEVN